MDRKIEIREILNLTSEEVIDRAGDRLRICEDIDELHRVFARDMFDLIYSNNKKGKLTRVILPVGPTGQYPYFADLVKEHHLSLNGCTFFFMDEYCDEMGKAMSADHPLSFKREVRELLLNKLPEDCGLRNDQIIFPDEYNIQSLAKRIKEDGGIDTCYGGIGIHGHIAFNEPEEGVSASDPRKVQLNDFTITINAMRSQVGGNLECFPKEAFTLGLQQCLGAKHIRLFCRNGIDLDWANTILRLALFGTPGEDYPVTLIRPYDYLITTDWHTLSPPKYLI